MVDQKVMNHSNCSDLPEDMLEAVMTKLPMIDLLSASCVSNDWLHAVCSSLHTQPRTFPWLILQCLPHPTASTYSIHALDPQSRTWLSVTCHKHCTEKQLPPAPCFLYGSNRDLMYTLSFSKLMISKDPFGIASRAEVKGPNVWRQDPVVAEVGRWVVVVGGGFLMDLDEGEEEGAVEVYDKETGLWELAEPMPTNFDGSTYSSWLSVAVSDKRLYVIEKKTGWISYFDPESKKWGPICQLTPDPSVTKWAIGIVGKERLILVGAGSEGGDSKGVMKVNAWEVEGDTLQLIGEQSEEMPREMMECLFPNFDSLDAARQRACSVEVHGTESGGYMFDPTNIKNGTVMYQLPPGEAGKRRSVGSWDWVPCPATVGCDLMERISVGCSPVPLHDVARCFL